VSDYVDFGRLERIRERLQLLGRCDAERQVFGAHQHQYQLAPPLAEAELAEFERTHGVSLPADYRAFLTTLGNGGAGPFYGLAPLSAEPPRFAAKFDGTQPSLARPFPLHEAWPQGDHASAPPIAPGTSIYDGLVLLSDQGCGYFDVLIISGPQRGRVWADITQALGGLMPWYDSFLAAYEAWLDRAYVEWACVTLNSQHADDEHTEAGLAIAGPLLERAVAERASPPSDPALLSYPTDAVQLLAALAYLRARQGRTEESLALFDELPAAFIGDGEARRRLGRARVFAGEGSFERALEEADAGLAVETLWFATELQLLREKRMLLRDLERDEDALEVFRQLADMQSSELFPQYDLAWALLEQGRIDDAAAVLIGAAERGLACNEDDPLAQRIEQVARGLLDALENEGLGQQATALRERLDR
jgi:tetratricopeptide (TPR) repeat protein